MDKGIWLICPFGGVGLPSAASGPKACEDGSGFPYSSLGPSKRPWLLDLGGPYRSLPFSRDSTIVLLGALFMLFGWLRGRLSSSLCLTPLSKVAKLGKASAPGAPLTSGGIGAALRRGV